jgi:hypothetical protein
MGNNLMKISVNQINEVFIKLNTDVSNDISFSQQLQLYYRILSENLLNKEIAIITLQPQHYSIGYELEGEKELKKIKGKSFLFNKNLSCNSRILLEILQSEEFRRGLLFVVEGQNMGLDEIAYIIVRYYEEAGLTEFNVNASFYFTERDGNTLCLCNAKSTKEDLSEFLIDSR